MRTQLTRIRQTRVKHFACLDFISCSLAVGPQSTVRCQTFRTKHMREASTSSGVQHVRFRIWVSPRSCLSIWQMTLAATNSCWIQKVAPRSYNSLASVLFLASTISGPRASFMYVHNSLIAIIHRYLLPWVWCGSGKSAKARGDQNSALMYLWFRFHMHDTTRSALFRLYFSHTRSSSGSPYMEKMFVPTPSLKPSTTKV